MARDIGPDGVIINAAGTITMQDQPFFENGLTALAVRDGNIIAIGCGESILSMAGPVPVVDLCTPSRAWIDSGALVGAGTDSPVAGYDPWLNIYGFATRDTEVTGIIGPEHRISIAEALRAYTVGSAEILGMGGALGSLEVGKAADFICLERDPLASAPDEVRHMKVTRTFVGGKQVYPAAEDE